MKNDRRRIEPLLASMFPDMVGKSSDEWHGFLNAQTGLSIPLDMQNGLAFDLWRQALAKDVPELWPYSETRLAEVQAAGAVLVAKEQERQAALEATLDVLAKEAPLIAPADAIKT